MRTLHFIRPRRTPSRRRLVNTIWLVGRTLRTASPFVEHVADRSNRVPVARGRRHSEEPVDRSQIADRLHLAPVEAEDESPLSCENSQQPRALRRKVERDRRIRTLATLQHAHKADDV